MAETREPKRIQRRRTKGWRKPEGAVIVDRTSRWGNPFRIVRASHGLVVQWSGVTEGAPVGVWPSEVAAREFAVNAYRSWINQPEQDHLRTLARDLLCERDLVCPCPLPAEGESDHCHAAYLIELANGEPDA